MKTENKMLPRERIMKVLAGEETDRVPFQEIFFGHQAVAEYFGGLQKTPEDAARYLANSGQCSYLVGGFWWTLQSKYLEVEHDVKRYAGGDAITMDDVINMQPPIFEERIDALNNAIAAARKYNLATHVFLMNSFHSASTSMGLDNLALALYDTPEIVESYMNKIEEYNRSVLHKLSKFDIDFVFFDGDCAYKNGLMINPRMFRDIWFDKTKATIEVCQKYGWPYCYHTDGKIDEVYPLLIELGFSATHGVEAAANSLAEIKSKFGKQITLIGNFDIADLAFKTSAEIHDMTVEMLKIGSQGGRYIAACNTLPGNNIPLENYLAFRDTIVNF